MERTIRVVAYFGFCVVLGYCTGKYFTAPICNKAADILLK